MVARELRAAGHRVIAMDRVGERSPDFVRVDTTDYGQVIDALPAVNDTHDGVDALVHLAAIPAPGPAPDVATFHNNMLTTFNVFWAATRLGITRIVYASSETVLGLPFDADPRERKWNLWGYIDARDGAQAVQRALEAAPSGFDHFIIAAADTVTTRPNAELVTEVFPSAPLRGGISPAELGKHDTMLAIDKARRLLGFDPQHSWRDHQ